MSRTQMLRLAAIAAVAMLCLGWILIHTRWRAPRQAAAPASIPTGAANPDAAAVAGEDRSTTVVYAHNIKLRKGPDFRVYIRWIRGEMRRTHAPVNPSFDDPDSFVLYIDKGVIRANIGDVSNFLNSNSPADAPLKNISLEPAGNQIKLHGTVHKIVPLPVELVGTLAPTSDGRVQFHVNKLNVLKLPLKGLLGGFHVELSDLVHATNVPGIQIAGNDIFFDTQTLLPPPHIHGKITSVLVSVPDIEVVYGASSTDEAKLAQWHNFLRLRGGTVAFGKFTMHHADLTMIDASQDPWFDLDLVNYQAQLVNGYSRMTPQAGIEIFMPDLDEKAPQKSSKSITLEWLKDRNSSLPSDVPVK